jgi:hypothetical protein
VSRELQLLSAPRSLLPPDRSLLPPHTSLHFEMISLLTLPGSSMIS